jgi:hypothetical protein
MKKPTKKRAKPKQVIPPPPPFEFIPDPVVKAKIETWWESVKRTMGW